MGEPVTGTIKPGDLRDSFRLFYIRKELNRLVDEVDPTLVVVEGYAMGFTRGQGRLADLGELGGTVKLALWERGIDVMIAPPATLKSAIAENGRADKSEIKAALRQRYGYHITNPDEADALGLMLLGEIRCGKTRLQAHAKRMASVTNCEVIRGQIKLGA